MKARVLLAMFVAIALGAFTATAASGDSDGSNTTADGGAPFLSDPLAELPVTSLIVQASEGQGILEKVAARIFGSNSPIVGYIAAGGGKSIVRLGQPLTLREASEVAEALEADPNVQWAEPNKINRHFTYPSSPPNDPSWNDMWNLWDTNGVGIGVDRLSLSSAWSQGRGAGITVAVLDTGYISHPDLTGQIVAGYDFVSSIDTGWDREIGVPASYSNLDGDVVRPSTYGKVGRDNNPLDPGDWSMYLDEEGDLAHADSSWHGTHVAGTIAAATNNGIGIAGVAPQAKIQPIRVLSWFGGFDSDIADAIRWASGASVSGATRNRTPAKIINLSFGSLGACGVELQSAINTAVSRGSIVVAAAGNSGDDPVAAKRLAANFSPANCDNVVTVAATGWSGDRAYYSNYGDAVEIAAPGGDVYVSGSLVMEDAILSTVSSTEKGYGYPGYSGGLPTPSYGWYQGTSMAAPHVAGALAVLWSAKPSWSASQVVTRLYDTARNAGLDCTATGCGEGIVDLSAALEPTAPDSPVSIRVSAGTGSGRVSWKAPASNGGSAILDYTANLFLAASGGVAVGTCSTSSLSCTVSGLGRRAIYYVEVVATNAIGSSDPSAPRVRFRTR